jgi:hypothetical protein
MVNMTRSTWTYQPDTYQLVFSQTILDVWPDNRPGPLAGPGQSHKEE